MLDYHVLGERVGEDGTHDRARPARRRLPRARRPLRRRLQEGRHQARRHRPRGVRAPARAGEPPRRDAAPADAALVAVAIGHDRSTFAVSDGRVCEFTRVLDWGGWYAQRRDRPRARPGAVRGRAGQARALARADERARRAHARAGRSAAREGVGASSRRSRASSSPRSSSTRTSPDRWASARSCITGGTAHLAGLAEELRAADRRPRRASATRSRACKARQEGSRDRAARLARGRNRPGDRGLSTCARSTFSPRTTPGGGDTQKKQWIVARPGGGRGAADRRARGGASSTRAARSRPSRPSSTGLKAELAAIPTPDACRGPDAERRSRPTSRRA